MRQSLEERAYSTEASRVWAKSEPVYPLWRHLLDVAAVARELMEVFPPPAGLPPDYLATVLGLHDIGKADPLFQLKAPELAATNDPALFRGMALGWGDAVRGFRHEARSAEYLRDAIRPIADDEAREVRDLLRRVVRGHHGDFGSQALSETEYPEDVARRWREIRDRLTLETFTATGASHDAPPMKGRGPDVLGVHLSAVLVAADWIASNPRLFSHQEHVADPASHFSRARELAREALRSLQIVAPASSGAKGPVEWGTLFGPEFAPRGVQRVVATSAIAPGLVIIEAATGEGKTEAALYLAEHWQRELNLRGVYFALPTQATSNDLHRRYAEFLRRNRPEAAPLLVHGMAWLLDVLPDAGEVDAADPRGTEQRTEAAAWIRNSRRALLAPHAVGTVDQVLMAALAVRFGFLRLLGLSRKVLIVDEVHACDTFMLERLGRVLHWCRVQGTPVILLSATLPRSQREQLLAAWYGARASLPGCNAYPLVTAARFDPQGQAQVLPSTATGQTRSVAVRLESHVARQPLAQPVVQALLGPADTAGCAALFLNTVVEAQAAYGQLQSAAVDGRPVVLFHARFPAWRRVELEGEMRRRFGRAAVLGKDRPTSALVIATQVMEQSLDVDFDFMVSALAPIDALLQRAGRLHRHPRERSVRGGQQLLVMAAPASPDASGFGASAKVYSELLLLRTREALSRTDTLELPRDYRALIEAVYTDPSPLDDAIPSELLQPARAAAAAALDRQRQEAQRHLIGPPDPASFAYPNNPVPWMMDEAEEGQEGDNLRARTRLGDTTTAVLAITREEEREALRRYRSGQRALGVRRALMAARVAVPSWWLKQLITNERAEHLVVLEFDDAGACMTRPGMQFTPEMGVFLSNE